MVTTTGYRQAGGMPSETEGEHVTRPVGTRSRPAVLGHRAQVMGRVQFSSRLRAPARTGAEMTGDSGTTAAPGSGST